MRYGIRATNESTYAVALDGHPPADGIRAVEELPRERLVHDRDRQRPRHVAPVEVAAGETVTKGKKLLTLEAMKMEHSLTAPFDGTIAALNAAAGGQVSEGALLVRVDAAE